MADYESRCAQVESALRDALRGLEGRRLLEVFIQVVEPEINMAFLRFEDALYAVIPWDGGALVEVVEWDKELPVDLGPGAWYQPFAEAMAFRGRSVKQARAIGCAWNGHGIEISFSGEQARTLIIQSIMSGDLPEGLQIAYESVSQATPTPTIAMRTPNKPQELTSREETSRTRKPLATRLAAQGHSRWADAA